MEISLENLHADLGLGGPSAIHLIVKEKGTAKRNSLLFSKLKT